VLANGTLSEKIYSLLIDKVPSLVAPHTEKYGITEDYIRSILSETITQNDVANILIAFVNDFIDAADEIQEVKSYRELVFLILRKNNVFNAIKNSASKIVEKLLENEVVRTNITDILMKFLKSKHLDTNIESAKLHNLVQDLTSFIKNNPTANGLLKNFVTSLIVNIQANVLETDDILLIVKNSLKSAVSATSQDLFKDNTINKLINGLIESRLVTKNAATIKQLLKNLLSNPDNIIDKLVGSFLPQPSDSSYKFVERENVKDLVTFVLTHPEFKSIAGSLIDVLVDNINNFANMQNTKDISFVLLKSIVQNTDNQKLKNFLNSILNYVKERGILKNIIKRYFELIGLNSGIEKYAKLINDLNLQLDSFINDYAIVDQLIDQLYTNVQNSISSNDFFNNLTSLFTPVLSNLIQSNEFSIRILFDKLFNSRIYNENSEAISDLISASYDYLKNKEIFRTIINALVNKIPPALTQYISLGELQNLVYELIRSEEVDSIFKALLQQLITNKEWFKKLPNWSAAIGSILQNEQFKNLLKNQLPSVINQLAHNPQFSRILVGLLNNWIVRNHLDTNISDTNALVNLFYNVVRDNVLDAATINNLIAEIIDALAAQNSEQGSNFGSQIFKLLEKSAWRIFKDIINNPQVEAKYSDIRQLVTNIFNHYSSPDKIAELVAFIQKFQILPEFIDTKAFETFMQNLITQAQVKELFLNLLDQIHNNKAAYSQLDSFNELVKAIFADNQSPFVQQFKTSTKLLITQIIENTATKDFLTKSITNLIKNQNNANDWIFEGVSDLQTLVSNLISIINNLETELQFKENLSNVLITNFANNGLEFSKFDWSGLFRQIISFDNPTQTEQQIIALVKKVAAMPEFTTLANDLKQILFNVYNRFKNHDGTIEKFVENLNLLLPSLVEPIFNSQQNLVKLIKFLVNNQDFDAIFKSLVGNIFNNVQSLSNANSYGDLIKLMLQNFDFDSLEQNFKNLFNELITNDVTKTILKEILSKQIAKYVTTNASQIDTFTTKLVNDLPQISQILSLADTIIPNLFAKLKEIQTSTNPLEVFDSLISSIFKDLIDKVSANPYQFAKSILDLPSISSHRPLVAELVENLYEQISKSINWQPIAQKIAKILSDKSNSLIDQTEVSVLINSVLSIPQTHSIIKKLIANVIQTPEILNQSDTNKLLDQLLFTNSINGQIAPFVSEILDTILPDQLSNLTVTLSNLINKQLQKFNLSLTQDEAKTITSDLIKLIKQVAEKLGGFSQLSTKIGELLAQSTSVSDFTNKVIAHFSSLFNLSDYSWFKLIISSELVQNNKELLKSKVVALVDFLVTNEEVRAKIKEIDLATKINSQDTSINETFKSLVDKYLANDDLKTLFKNAIEFLFDNVDAISKFNSYNELVQFVLKQRNFWSQNQDLLVSIAKQILNDEQIQSLIAKFADSYTAKDEWSWVFEKVTNKSEWIKQAIKSLVQIEGFINLSNKIITPLINWDESQNFDLNNYINKVIDLFKTEFNNEATIINLIKQIVNTPLLNQQKDNTFQIIKNIYNRLATNEELLDKLLGIIPSALKSQINNSITDVELKTLIQKVLTNNDFKNVIFSALDSAKNNLQNLNNASSYSDLIKILVANINFDTSKIQIKRVINSLLSDSSVQRIFGDFVRNWISNNLGIDAQDAQLNSFTTSLAQNLQNLLNTQNVYDELLDIIFNKLKTAQASDDFLDNFAGVSSEIINYFKTMENPIGFIKEILNQAPFSTNKDLLAKILNKLYDKFISNESMVNKAKEVIKNASSNATLNKYADANELAELFVELINNKDFNNIIHTTIDNLITNQNWLNNSSDLASLSFAALKQSQIFNNSQGLSNVINTILKSPNLQNTWAKVLNTVLAQKVSQNITITPTFAKDLITTITNVINQNGTLAKIITAANTALTSSNNWNEFANSVFEQIAKVIDFKDYSYMHAFLRSDFALTHKDELHNLISQIFDEYIKTNDLSFIDNSSIFNSLAKYNINTNELITLIKNTIKSDSVKEILLLISDDLSTNLTQYRLANSYNQLFKSIIQNVNQNRTLETKIVAIVKKIINDSNAKELISKIISQELNNEKIAPIFANLRDKDGLIRDFVNLYDTLDTHLDLSVLITRAFLINASENGLEFNLSSIISSIFGAIKQKFTGDNANQLIFNLLQDLLSSDFISNNKDDIKQIFKNLFNLFKTNDEFTNNLFNLLIPESSRPSLEEYISFDEFKTVVKFVINHASFERIFNNVITKTLDNVEQLKQATDLNDLIKKVLNNIDFNQIKNDIKNLVTDLLTQNSIKNILKNTLRKTLQTNGVTIDANVENFVNDFVDSAKQILDAIDLFDPILDKVTQVLNESKNSPDATNIISQIQDAISNLIKEKVTNNVKAYAQKILEIPTIANHKTTIVKIINQVLRHLVNNDTITSIVNKQIDKLDITSKIFEYANGSDLKLLIDHTIKAESFLNLVELVLPQLIDNLDWLDHLNEPIELIKSILTLPNLIEQNKNNVKNLINTILSNENFGAILVKSAKKLAQEQNLDLSSVSNFDLLGKSFSKNLVPLLQSWGIYDDLINNTLNVFKDAQNYTDLANSIINAVKPLFDFSNYKFVKGILNSEIILNNQQAWKDLFNTLIDYLINDETKIDTLLSKLDLKKSLLPNSSISSETLNGLVKKIIKNDELVQLLKSALAVAVDSAPELKNANSYDELFKMIFANSTIKQQIKTPLIKLLKAILNDDEIVDSVALVAKEFISSNSNYSWMMNQVSQPQTLIKNIIQLVPDLDEQIDIFDKLFDSISSEITQNGFSINLSNVANSLISKIKNVISQNPDAQITQLLKTLIKNPLFASEANANDLKQFIKNILNYLADNKVLNDKLISALSTGTKAKLNKYISDEQMSAVISKILKSQPIYDLVTDIVDFFKANQNSLDGVNDLSSLIRTLLSDSQQNEQFKQHIKDLIEFLLKDSTIINTLKNVVNYFLNFSGVDTQDSKVVNFVNALVGDISAFLKRMDLFDKLVDPLIDQIAQTQDILGYLSNITSIVTTNLDISNYKVFAKLINDPIIDSHKPAIKFIAQSAFDTYVKSDGKLEKILSTLNIAKIIVGSDANVDYDLINRGITKVLRNEELFKVVNVLINSIVDSNKQYAQLSTWHAAIQKFLSSNEAKNIKTNILNWLNQTIDAENPDAKGAVGQIFASFLNKVGISTSSEDGPLLSQIAWGVLKGLKEQNKLSQMINKIFDKVQKVGYSNDEQYMNDLRNAIRLGALSIITTDDESQYDLGKILDLNALIRSIILNSGDANFVDFVNLLFDRSDLASRSGIYGILESLLKGSSSSSNSKPSGVHVGGTIFTASSRAQTLVKELVGPFYRQMHLKAQQNRLPKFITDDSSYRALFRVNEFLLWFFYKNKPSIVAFWNTALNRSDTMEGIVNLGNEKAFDEAKSWYPNPANTEKAKIGHSGNSFNKDYPFGSRNNWTSNSNYSNDQLLAYIYWMNSNPKDRHDPRKTKEQVLWEAFEKGYIGNKR
ncbi:hypothetical protein, partial [Mycoplasmopsis pullorum]|uniref:hypothetical protein n=1 Tax=Mycoplasmopsis pullorum TaxID=48003 RepID=UPI0015D5CB98